LGVRFFFSADNYFGSSLTVPFVGTKLSKNTTTSGNVTTIGGRHSLEKNMMLDRKKIRARIVHAW
jgi:hypothetical protein